MLNFKGILCDTREELKIISGLEKVGLLFRRLKWIVQALASAAPEQIKLFPGFVNVADELALIWENVLNDLDNLARELPKKRNFIS